MRDHIAVPRGRKYELCPWCSVVFTKCRYCNDYIIQDSRGEKHWLHKDEIKELNKCPISNL